MFKVNRKRTTGTIIKKMRTSQNLKAEELGEKLGVSQQYVTAIENDKKPPSVAFLEKIYKLFPFTPEDKAEISEYEEYRRLSEKMQNKFSAMERVIRLYQEQEKKRKERRNSNLFDSIYENVAQIFSSETPEGKIEIQNNSFGIIVGEEEKMEPTILSGDVIFLNREEEIEDEDIVLFRNSKSEEIKIQRVKSRGNIWILVDDGTSLEKYIDPAVIIPIGKVVGLYRNNLVVPKDSATEGYKSLKNRERKVVDDLIELLKDRN
jgi:transcriptional regulator with XRE-family HTH domain